MLRMYLRQVYVLQIHVICNKIDFTSMSVINRLKWNYLKIIQYMCESDYYYKTEHKYP